MADGEDLYGSLIEKGTVIFRQGDPGDALYIIQSGGVELSQDGKDGKRSIALLQKNDFFGEMALIDHFPRSCTATTVSRSRLLRLTPESLLQRMASDPSILLFLMKTLSNRIDGADHSRQKELLVQQQEACKAADEHGSLTSPEEAALQNGLPSPLPTGLLASYAGNDSLIDYKAGEVICRQGDDSREMFLIVKGKVEVVLHESTGSYRLALLGPSEIFGEMGLVRQAKRSATVIAKEPTRISSISRDDFLRRMRSQPEIGLSVLQTLTLRLRRILGVLPADAQKAGHDGAWQKALRPVKQGKVRLAFVSLSTCGGCNASLLNDQEELSRLLSKAEIEYCPMLMDRDHFSHVDVAFVDGLVRVQEDENILKETRLKSRYLVAWGTCASFGGIPAMANHYELEDLLQVSFGATQDPFTYYLSETAAEYELRPSSASHLSALHRRAAKLSEVVRVDMLIPGCPPQGSFLHEYVKEILGEERKIKIAKTVCAECSRHRSKASAKEIRIFPQDPERGTCFASQGELCLGLLTRGGCGGLCVKGGLPCWGCRGPSDTVLRKMRRGSSLDEILLHALIMSANIDQETRQPSMNVVRKSAHTLLNFYQNAVFDESTVL